MRTQRGVAVGLSLLFLFQVLSTLICFKSPAELVRSEPIINIDWCSQYYWSFAGRRFFSASGRLWGFDPYYMAGYPLDFIFNSSTPVQVSNLIFWHFPLGLVIKWFFLVSFVSVPFSFYFALRNFGLDKGPALAGSALGISYFWLGEDALFGNWGMISGAWLLNFFLLFASGFYRFLKLRDGTRYLFFVIYLTFGVFLHKTFIILLGLPGLILILIFFKSISRRIWFQIFLAAAFALLVNSFWLLPFFSFLPNKVEDPTTTFFQNLVPWRFILDLVPYPFPGIALGRLVILLPALYGMVRMRKSQGLRELFWFSIFSYSAFFGVVYFGSFISVLRHLQPYRYLTALFFLLLPVAGFGLKELRERIGRRNAGLAKLAPGGLILLVIGLQFIPSFRSFYAVSPLTSEWPRKVLELRDWLEKNTDQSARIMMEDINRWEGKLAPYGPSRFVGLLPALMPRYLIGGPLPNAFIKHHYASFHDGYFLNRLLQEYNDEELAEKLALYNIKWIVAFSPSAKERLHQFPGAQKVRGFEELEVFEVQGEPNWFLIGAGKMNADYDKIELKELKPEDGIVVLKMHWLKGFQAEPGCEIFRYEISGDPIGFLGLKAPSGEVLLKYEP